MAFEVLVNGTVVGSVEATVHKGKQHFTTVRPFLGDNTVERVRTHKDPDPVSFSLGRFVSINGDWQVRDSATGRMVTIHHHQHHQRTRRGPYRWHVGEEARGAWASSTRRTRPLPNYLFS